MHLTSGISWDGINMSSIINQTIANSTQTWSFRIAPLRITFETKRSWYFPTNTSWIHSAHLYHDPNEPSWLTIHSSHPGTAGIIEMRSSARAGPHWLPRNWYDQLNVKTVPILATCLFWVPRTCFKETAGSIYLCLQLRLGCDGSTGRSTWHWNSHLEPGLDVSNHLYASLMASNNLTKIPMQLMAYLHLLRQSIWGKGLRSI